MNKLNSNLNNYLIVTRGAPASGKSTFVNDKLYPRFKIVSSDAIRLEIAGLNENGRISQAANDRVWGILYSKVIQAIRNKQDVVIDSTAVSKAMIKKYYKIAQKNKYTFILLDFSSVSLLQCLQNNRQREKFRFVPVDVIERMHNQIKSQELGDLESYVIDYKQFNLKDLL